MTADCSCLAANIRYLTTQADDTEGKEKAGVLLLFAGRINRLFDECAILADPSAFDACRAFTEILQIDTRLLEPPLGYALQVLKRCQGLPARDWPRCVS